MGLPIIRSRRWCVGRYRSKRIRLGAELDRRGDTLGCWPSTASPTASRCLCHCSHHFPYTRRSTWCSMARCLVRTKRQHSQLQGQPRCVPSNFHKSIHGSSPSRFQADVEQCSRPKRLKLQQLGGVGRNAKGDLAVGKGGTTDDGVVVGRAEFPLRSGSGRD